MADLLLSTFEHQECPRCGFRRRGCTCEQGDRIRALEAEVARLRDSAANSLAAEMKATAEAQRLREEIARQEVQYDAAAELNRWESDCYERELARLRRVEDAARALLQVVDECIVAREHRLQGGGQQVGYHGPLAAAVPSVLRDLRQMVAPLRAALAGKEG